MKPGAGDQVFCVECCQLRVGEAEWPFACENAAPIDRHWQRATLDNPDFFDGVILMTSNVAVKDGVLSATLFKTRFRNYLYWRHQGFAGSGITDGFGSGLIRSADGAIVLVRQGSGNVNAGIYYTPIGFIDPRDIDDIGYVDIAANITREIEEETGLTPAELARRPGYIVAATGAQLAMAVVFDCELSAPELELRINTFLANEERPELAEIRLVKSLADTAGLELARHTALQLQKVFAA